MVSNCKLVWHCILDIRMDPCSKKPSWHSSLPMTALLNYPLASVNVCMLGIEASLRNAGAEFGDRTTVRD